MFNSISFFNIQQASPSLLWKDPWKMGKVDYLNKSRDCVIFEKNNQNEIEVSTLLIVSTVIVIIVVFVVVILNVGY